LNKIEFFDIEQQATAPEVSLLHNQVFLQSQKDLVLQTILTRRPSVVSTVALHEGTSYDMQPS
jgi:hypothetical protein